MRGFVIYILPKYYYVDKIKNYEVMKVRTRPKKEYTRNKYNSLVGNPRESD